MYKFAQNKVSEWQKFLQTKPFGIEYSPRMLGELDYDLIDAIKSVENKMQINTGKQYMGLFANNNGVLKGPEDIIKELSANQPEQNSEKVTPTNVSNSPDSDNIISFKKYLKENGIYNGEINSTIEDHFVAALKNLEDHIVEAIKVVQPSFNADSVRGMIWDGNKLNTTVDDVEAAISILTTINKTAQATVEVLDIMNYPEDMPIAMKLNPTQDDLSSVDYAPEITQQIGSSEVNLPVSGVGHIATFEELAASTQENLDDDLLNEDDKYIELAKIYSKLY